MDPTVRYTGSLSLVFNPDGSSVLTEKDGSRATFGSDLLLRTLSDTAGNTLTLEYQGSRLAAVAHSDGDRITIGYDGSGKIISLSDPFGRQTTFTYQDTLLTSITTPEGVTNYQYSQANGGFQLSGIIYPGGVETNFETDSSGKIFRISSNGGREAVSYAYDTDNHVTTTTDATGSSLKTVVNDDGNVISMTDQVPSTALFSYTGKWDMTRYTDPNGKEYATEYDASHNPITMTDAAGSQTRLVYDPQFNTPITGDRRQRKQHSDGV